jgi:hypothetical protein
MACVTLKQDKDVQQLPLHLMSFIVYLVSFHLISLSLNELYPRRRVFDEISNPSMVELKCNAECFDVILATPVRVLVSHQRPESEGLIPILKYLQICRF